MKNTLLNFSLSRPRTVYLLVLGMVIATLAMLPAIQIDTDPENMLPEQNSARLFHNAVKQRFAMHDTIVVGVVNEPRIYQKDVLNRLYTLSKQVLEIEGVVETELLAISEVDNIVQQGPGTISFEWMMAKPLLD